MGFLHLYKLKEKDFTPAKNSGRIRVFLKNFALQENPAERAILKNLPLFKILAE